jgi:hypothetical protein
MSEPENFLTRWSRRKRSAADDADAAEPAPAAPPDGTARDDERRTESKAPVARSDAPGLPELPFDPTKLPPIDSITAESDIRAFLAPGVPPELTRAALRRAWVADPKIRDFVGLADYAWDFTAPDSITGFGPLPMTDELRRQVAEMVGRSLGTESDRPAGASAEGQGGQGAVETSNESVAATTAAPPQLAQDSRGKSQDEPSKNDSESSNAEAPSGPEQDIAAQYESTKPDNGQLIAKRSHGRALPKG